MNFLKKFSAAVVAVVVVVFTLGWGFWAHPVISKEAVGLLPEPLKNFYSANVDYLSKHSSDPDIRRNEDKNEGYYHYIDIDKYGKYPNFDIPHSYDAAVKKYGADTVMKNGVVPWRVGWITDSLTAAMKSGNVAEVLHFSTDLSHYVADMHVPLHATENYDGQMTGNIGVHARWESGIPEHFGSTYNFTGIDSASYIENPVEHAFGIIMHSYSLIGKVFGADSLARSEIPKDQLYRVEERGGRKTYIYSEDYYTKFNSALDGMVESQMRKAAKEVASYWYTAWVNAGKPKFWSN